MIYEIVNFRTGESIRDTSDCSLKKLKRSLRFTNTGCWLVDGEIQYAIACLLPSQVFVTTNKSTVLVAIAELGASERAIFWNYYATHSSYEIPYSEFKKAEVL